MEKDLGELYPNQETALQLAERLGHNDIVQRMKTEMNEKKNKRKEEKKITVKYLLKFRFPLPKVLLRRK